MRTVRPVEPIQPIRGVRRIRLRRVPSIRQLRMWLAFARQKAKDAPAQPPASGQAAVAAPEASADWASEEQMKAAADHGHLDKRV